MVGAIPLTEPLHRVLGATTVRFLRRYKGIVDAIGLTGSCAKAQTLKRHSDVDVLVLLRGARDAREVFWEGGSTVDVFIYSAASLDRQLDQRLSEFPVNLLADVVCSFDPQGILRGLRAKARSVRQGPRVVRPERQKPDYAQYMLSKLWKTDDPTEFNYIAGLFAQACFRGYVNVRNLWPESMARLCAQVSALDPTAASEARCLLADGPREARVRAAERLLNLTFSIESAPRAEAVAI